MSTLPVEAVGPYRLDSLLGRGGMGEVYKAFDQRLGRSVAIKHVLPHAAGDPAARDRFRREARTAARLGHPAIAQVFDVLDHDGDAWIVMELIEGPTLLEVLQGGPIDVGLAVAYGQQVASALAMAHARDIVHRDLKSENVMIMPSGHVKVLDFGLAKSRLPEQWVKATPQSFLSAAGHVVGTPHAMSPEQARGREVDARSDLFSLGVLLYEMLTGRSPFRAATVDATLERVKSHQQASAKKLNPRIPSTLSDLIDLLLEKDPAHRPVSAEAVVEALVDVASENRLVTTMEGKRRLVARSLAPSPEDDVGGVANEVTAAWAPVDDGAVIKTLLLADLVDKSRLFGELDDGAAAELTERHGQLARRPLAAHQGFEIDKADGLLLLFDRPWNAVLYAMAYHQAICQLAAELGIALAARVGIHLGEIILHRNPPDDVLRGSPLFEVDGPAKSTTARLAALASGTQTLLTRSAYNVARRGLAGDGSGSVTAAGTAGDLLWLEHGSYRFHGIAGEAEVFEVGVPGSAPLVAPESSATVTRVASASNGDTGGEGEPVRLRPWPAPELPEHPYPVLLPYTHPALFAGREQEIAKLRRLLGLPIPVLGLSAPSGTGKSSLLLGGLVPVLREQGRPVAVVRHPREQGVADRLLGDLILGSTPSASEPPPWRQIIERLIEIERLAGEAPVLVLDQFEEVMRPEAGAARAALGVLLAASAQRRPGIESPPCRWLLVYRQEFHGEVMAWLHDVLADAQSSGIAGIETLPHDLSGSERFHSMQLSPLATPAPGSDALTDATRIFLAAIQQPLDLPGLEGAAKVYPWRFASNDAEKLARAFAEARLAQPDAPLAPELQVVLAHLLARTGDDGVIEVPEDPGSLIDRALEAHLQRALKTAFPDAESSDVATRRARALLALYELANTIGAREEHVEEGQSRHGLPLEVLSRAIGEGGEQILEDLSTPLTRLVVLREHADGWRYVLSHERMAEAVVRVVEAEMQGGELMVDGELLRLRRFVALESALYRSGKATAPRLSRRHFQQIAANTEALLWDDERRVWWAACRRRRRTDQRRAVARTLAATTLLALLVFAVWSWVATRAARRALLDQVTQGEPEAALQALEQLRQEENASDLLATLRQRQIPSDLLERGLAGLEEPERSMAVLAAVELMLPMVESDSHDPVLIANLVWALDYSPAHQEIFRAQAQELRDRVMAPLRKRRPPPQLPAPGDPDWIEIPAGSFLMGSNEGEGRADEHPRHRVTVSAFRMQRHEVTNGEYRRLVPDHDGQEDLPALFPSWYDAVTYAAWLGGRLPTEAEWEYAARAGCAHRYCDDQGRAATLDEVAWNSGNSADAAGEPMVHEVMLLAPNPWRLYDMLGNLWEWTANWRDEYSAEPQVDPKGPASPPADGGKRVSRGSHYGNPTQRARFAARSAYNPAHTAENRGLRIVLPTARPISPR